MKSPILKEFRDRGFLHQSTDLEKLDAVFSQKKVTAYQGFDATGDSLHAGHLTGIMMLRCLERMGHQPIVLLGGATTLVGDPSDKEKERPLLQESVIQQNLESIKKIFRVYLKDPIIVNNADWLKDLKYLEFLREIGRHFSINRMVGFEFVKNRLENNKPLTFLEFNYMILQGYDFYHLFTHYKCDLQLGGSDQWGNILNGVELIHKMTGKEAHALTMPLLTTSSGTKMGKTGEGKAVWLNADKTSPYDFWQYFRNVDDKDVQKCFHIFTDVSVKDIQDIMSGDINIAKKILADETTKMLHGEDSLPAIHNTVSMLFENKTGDLSSLPVLMIKDPSMKLLDALVDGGLYKSKSEAKSGVIAGAVRVNEQKISDPFLEMVWENDMIVSVGKKNHYRVKI